MVFEPVPLQLKHVAEAAKTFRNINSFQSTSTIFTIIIIINIFIWVLYYIKLKDGLYLTAMSLTRVLITNCQRHVIQTARRYMC